LRGLLLIIFVFFLVGGRAQSRYDFNANCRQAYAEIISLRLVNGSRLIEEEKKAHPDNLIPYFLDNYIDFFTLFFNEDPAVYRIKKPESEKLLTLLKSGDASSPFHLFTRSMVEFQWAAVDIKFGNRFQAAWEFRRSFLLSGENLDQFPDFQPSLLLTGAMEVAAGTIPPGYKWLSSLLGIHGTIREGMQKIEQVIVNDDPGATLFRDEAIFYKLYLKFYIENKKEEVFRFIKGSHLDIHNNYLFAYMAANLALNNQDAPFAEKVIRERSKAPGYFETEIWDLEMGYAKADHLDPGATVYLERFVKNFKGKFYVKDVLQKLSWLYYLQGNAEKAARYRSLILTSGNTDTEADKKALKDASSGRWPNPVLLKARLLDDGGYFNESILLLDGKSTGSFTLPEDQVEFAYRMGRLYDASNRKDDAIGSYQTAFRLGEFRKEYFAARAALQIGFIYEERGDLKTAADYFEKVLALRDHEYKNALDQKAKAGLERCGTP
jgi:tetratricopeptide (TPR) repeat protein